MRRARRSAGAALLALALAAGGWLALRALRGGSDAPSVRALPELRFEVEPSADGFRADARAVGGGVVPAGAELTVRLVTAAGPVALRRVQPDDAATLSLDIPWPRAGALRWYASLGEQRAAGVARRAPGPAISPLELVPSDRAVRLGSDPDPLLIAVPRDRHGNVTDDPVAVRATLPDGSVHARVAPVRHQLAWTVVPAGDAAGRLRAVAVAAGARGERAEVELLPGPPAAGRLTAPEADATVAGRDRWRLELGAVADSAGRSPESGEAVRFEGALAASGWRLWSSRPLVAGAAALELAPPPAPGVLEVRARSGSGTPLGAAARLRAAPLAAAELAVVWNGDGGLLVGPVIDPDGAYPDDGTPLELRVLDAAGNELLAFSASLHTGGWRGDLPPLPAGAVAIEIHTAGRSALLPLPEAR